MSGAGQPEARLALDVLLQAMDEVNASADSLVEAMAEVADAGDATAGLAACTAEEAAALGVAAAGIVEGADAISAGAGELEHLAADLAEQGRGLTELAGWLLDLLARLADEPVDVAAQMALVRELLSESMIAQERALAGAGRASVAGGSIGTVGGTVRAMRALVARSAERAGHTARLQQLRVDAAMAGVRDVQQRIAALRPTVPALPRPETLVIPDTVPDGLGDDPGPVEQPPFWP